MPLKHHVQLIARDIRDGRLIRRARRVLWEKPVIARRRFVQVKDRYPQTTLFFAGFAKSGSTWLERMLCDALGFVSFFPARWPLGADHRHQHDLYPGIFSPYQHKLAIIKGHTWAWPENIDCLHREYQGRYLLGVRDPRDAVISAYWYIRRHPDHWDYARVQGMDLQAYIATKVADGSFFDEFTEWMQLWLERRRPQRCVLARYEDLIANTPAELSRIIQELGFPCTQEQVASTTDRYRFEAKSGRRQGEENTAAFLRKGVAGEWQETWPRDSLERVEVRCAPLLRTLGYAAPAPQKG